MERKRVGEVTQEEKSEIKSLYERKLALQEMLFVLPDKKINEEAKNELYERIMIDLGTTKLKFDSWWGDKFQKYNWVITDEGDLSIDFLTNEIYIAIK